MAHTRWYYLDENDQQVGPVESPTLRRRVAEGLLKKTDLIWREGLKEWVEAGKVRGLFGSDAAAPVPERSGARHPAGATAERASRKAPEDEAESLPSADELEEVVEEDEASVFAPAVDLSAEDEAPGAGDDAGYEVLAGPPVEEPVAVPMAPPTAEVRRAPKQRAPERLVEAGWVVRFIAFVIDLPLTAFIIAISGPVLWYCTRGPCAYFDNSPSQSMRHVGPVATSDMVRMCDVILAIFILPGLYFGFSESFLGGSLGKRLLRLRVTNLNGKRISIMRGVMRFSMVYINAFLVLGMLTGRFIIIWRSGALPHDHFTRTRVMKRA